MSAADRAWGGRRIIAARVSPNSQISRNRALARLRTDGSGWRASSARRRSRKSSATGGPGVEGVNRLGGTESDRQIGALRTDVDDEAAVSDFQDGYLWIGEKQRGKIVTWVGEGREHDARRLAGERRRGEMRDAGHESPHERKPGG